jgi:nucleoside-triphosphatase THEP1
MENLALIESFSEFKDDKLIDRVTLMSILEDVFRNALKKKFGDDDNFDIIINPDKGDLEMKTKKFHFQMLKKLSLILRLVKTFQKR